MSDNKKYYYLKLKDSFFESDSMIVLESMPDGYKYSNILLKLYLRSLKNEGKLMFNDRIPYNSTILAQVTRHSVGDVEKAISIFKDLDLIELLDNGAIFITDIQNFIGKSTTEADRKRDYRNKIEQEKKALLETTGQMSGQNSDKNPPEKEIEKDIDKELEKETDKEKDQSVGQSPFSYTWQDFFKDNGFGILSPYIQESFFMWLDDFKMIGSTEKDFDLIVIEALKVGVTKNSKTWNFVEGVLKNWVNQGLSNIESVEANEVARETKRKQTSGFYGNKAVRTETMPDWADEENTGEEIDLEKQKEFAERLERIRSREKQS